MPKIKLILKHPITTYSSSLAEASAPIVSVIAIPSPLHPINIIPRFIENSQSVPLNHQETERWSSVPPKRNRVPSFNPPRTGSLPPQQQLQLQPPSSSIPRSGSAAPSLDLHTRVHTPTPDNILHLANMEKIIRFQKMPCYKQKSKNWLDQRNKFLTASTIGAAIGALGPMARNNLLINKVSYGTANTFSGSVATHWGNKYEPVANALYCYRNHVYIYAFGVVTNDQYPELGVSPDGITIDNMIEIKCPYSRVIDGQIKTEYQHQIQEQLAVCDFDQSAFLECKFEETSEMCFWDDFEYYNAQENINREKGIIMAYYDYVEEDVEYLYSPIECYLERNHMKRWEQETLGQLQRDPKRLFLYQTYWYCTTYHCQMVQRDPQWIRQYYPILQAFWKEVIQYRQLGIDALMAKIQKDTHTHTETETVHVSPNPDIAHFYHHGPVKQTKGKSHCLL